MLKQILAGAAGLCLAACASQEQPVEAAAQGAQAAVAAKAETERGQAVRPPFDATALSPAAGGFAGNANVENFIAHEIRQGRAAREEWDALFARANHKSSIIAAMNKPATSSPWYQFEKGNSGEGKIRAGRAFYETHRAVIDRAAREYGVPSEIIVAILGIETNYGRNMGRFRLADALPTLAFDYPRRSTFFQDELSELMQMSREEGREPTSFLGSFAGAMGMPQFMPSSYRKWAVDYDGDGKRDIWNSVPDVAASVANYLKAHGWQSGKPVLLPVLLETNPQLQAVIEEKTALKYTVGELRKMGVVPLGEVADSERAVLFRLEVAPEQYEYFIGLNNFYTIWQYNHSRMYVATVRNIANGIGRGGL